ncbi:MAG TPA: HEAT repeat domain-containing protein [Verrucomicrobiae bacterium]|nr:HEAT repeat domain-containing protein [Verrucomicrobiae bacterium]
MPTPYQPRELVEDIQSRYSALEAATFWDCESLFKKFLAEGSPIRWLNGQLAGLLEFEVKQNEISEKQALMHQGDGWAISVATLEPARRFIHALPYYAFYSPLAEELVVDRYRLPNGFRSDVFDPSVRIAHLDTLNIAKGDVLKLETNQYAYDFRLTKSLPILRFASRCVRPLEWLFSRSTLQAWQANDAELRLTQLRVAAHALGKIAHQSSIDPLKRLSAHPHHAVRWAAIQNLGRLSRSAALAKIKEAVNDPHPHVKRAAQKTLEQLSGRPQPE